MKIRKVPILMYHAIQPKLGPAEYHPIGEAIFILSQTNFERQIQYLAQAGYQTISLLQLINFQPDTNLPDKAIIITFDDGHISNYTIAYPILKKYNFTATFFVTARRVGLLSTLSWHHIKEMLDNGMEIGSHTLTHRRLDRLREKEIKYEFSESKRIIEAFLRRNVNVLALPYGSQNRNTEPIAQRVGYQAICNSTIGYNTLDTNLFKLRRITIKADCNLSKFKQLLALTPTQLLYYRSLQAINRILARLVGLKTHGFVTRIYLRLKLSFSNCLVANNNNRKKPTF